MTKRWIVTALGNDRPGIVASVTNILYKLGCNLEDSAMTRLAGEFAIILIFSGPSKVTESKLNRALGPLSIRLRLAIHLKPLAGRRPTKPGTSGRPHSISVYGADRPGIVYRVSELLAAEGVNITDVQTHCSGAGGSRAKPALYLMVLEVELPRRVEAASLDRKLQRMAKKLRVQVSMHSAEASVL